MLRRCCEKLFLLLDSRTYVIIKSFLESYAAMFVSASNAIDSNLGEGRNLCTVLGHCNLAITFSPTTKEFTE